MTNPNRTATIEALKSGFARHGLEAQRVNTYWARCIELRQYFGA